MGNHYTPHYTYQYPPQPYHSQAPAVTFYHPHEPHPHPIHKPKGGLGSNGCLRCICCCYNCLLLVIVASFVISIFFLLHYQPKKPIYELKDFAVKRFDIEGTNLETEIALSVLAHNTNSKIELSYSDDNSIDVSYSGTKFCSGSFPPFEQPTKNTTMVNVLLKGNNEVNQTFQDSLERDQILGRIPLEIEIEVPVKFVHAGIKWSKMDATMTCTIIVDSLKSGHEARVFYNICKVKLELS